MATFFPNSAFLDYLAGVWAKSQNLQLLKDTSGTDYGALFVMISK